MLFCSLRNGFRFLLSCESFELSRGALWGGLVFQALFLISRRSYIRTFWRRLRFITLFSILLFFVSLGEKFGIIVTDLTLGRILWFLFNHVKSSFFVLFIIFFSAFSTNKSALLFEESLIFIVNLRVVLALPASHVLTLFSTWYVIVILSLRRAVLSLIISHICHVHHSHAAIVIAIILVPREHLLPGLLDLTDWEFGTF